MRSTLIPVCVFGCALVLGCGGGSNGSTAAVPGVTGTETVPLVTLPVVPLDAPTAVNVTEVSLQTVGGRSFGASSKLAVTWVAPRNFSPDHYLLTAIESVANTQVGARVAGTAISATLTQLKAATAYAVAIKACLDNACSASASSSVVSGTTPPEYWQLQGEGGSVSMLSKPVSDGNARLSATRFGAQAGANADTVQFYYGPLGVSGLSTAISSNVLATTPSSYLTFKSFANSSGLRSPGSASSGIKDIMTGQGVPLSAAMGAKVRLFFESNDVDGRTRIYSVDSVDGYTGRDFNQEAATTCSTSADYASDGNCPASLVIGVEGDRLLSNAKLSAVRQQKLGWPTLSDWRWDGTPGSFMVLTIDRIAGCTTASHNHAYAVWNGTQFVVQYDSAGCPKTFKSAQAAVPMHIGDVRYKMYYGDPSMGTGRVANSQLPFVGPKKLVYADGTSTADRGVVDFEDWEGVSVARNVHFLWPNGEMLNDAAEGYIDDFQVLTPTGSLDVQVIYLTITDGVVTPFAAAAVLLNP
jgi:hypothetical protein